LAAGVDATHPPVIPASCTAPKNVYYVSPNGDDNNVGTQASPFLTIQNAFPVLQAGDTLIVEPGTYNGAIAGWDGCYSTSDPNNPYSASDTSVVGSCPGDRYAMLNGTATCPIIIRAAAADGSTVIAARNVETRVGLDLEPGNNWVVVWGLTVTNTGTKGDPNIGNMPLSAQQGPGTITAEGIKVAGYWASPYLPTTNILILNNTTNKVIGIGGLHADNVWHVLIQGNFFESTQQDPSHPDTTGHNLYIAGSSNDVQVIGNDLSYAVNTGLHVNGDSSAGMGTAAFTTATGFHQPAIQGGVVQNLLVSGNRFYQNSNNSINLDGCQYSLFVNNLVVGSPTTKHGMTFYQMDAYDGSSFNTIVNNTFDFSMAPSSTYWIEDSACMYDNQSSVPTPAYCNGEGDTSKDNIFFNNIVFLSVPGNIVLYNDTTDNQTSARPDDVSLANNIMAYSSSLFVNYAGGNYSLNPTGPAIGAGLSSYNPGGLFSTFGNAPQDGSGKYDIGAFSFAP
jgi:hypothetical protein